MFATMYSTQAILPALGSEFGVSPAEAGLTVSAVVVALAVGAWVWGPLSDRIGRKRSLVLASALLVVPTIGAGLAPTFGTLLACRALQGACMPGLLTVGVPYVTEAFTPRFGARAMGYYVAALVAGGLVGRIGVALVTAAVGWRWGVGGMAVLPLAGAIVLQRTLPDLPSPSRSSGGSLRRQLTNPRVLRVAVVASTFFFTFVGTFSYVTYRLERPPFGYGTAAGSVVFVLWLLGASTPVVGRIVDRIGWRRVVAVAFGLCGAGLLLSFPSSIVTLVIGLAAFTLGNFAGVTAAQVGMSEATSVDRGAASAVHFSVYYASGGLGGYLPGLAWQTWHWNGVALVGLGVLSLGAVALVAGHDQG
jgi:MFS transporter, YNFM family, putative membrane transport protein